MPRGYEIRLILNVYLHLWVVISDGIFAHSYMISSIPIMLGVKQGGIKSHFLSLWYDSTWEWTQVSRAIGEHSNPYANVRSKVKLATVVRGTQKAPFSITTTLRCRGGRYYFPWIDPLYTWYVPYIAECLSKEASSTIFKVFDMTRPEIEPRTPGTLAKSNNSIKYKSFAYAQLNGFKCIWYSMYPVFLCYMNNLQKNCIVTNI